MVLCVLSISGYAAHQYKAHSVLSSGKWVKIAVTESGVYKMTYAELRGAGLNPDSVRVYGYGGAVLSQNFRRPKIDDLPSVPIYRGKDYILFYGQGVTAWSFNGAAFTHTLNTYSTQGYYFLTDNVGEQKVLQASEAVIGDNKQAIRAYHEYKVHELELRSLLDPDEGKNGGGQSFYGEKLNTGTPKITIPFTFTHTPLASEKMLVHAEVAGYSEAQSLFTLSCNGSSASCYTAPYTDNHTKGTTGRINAEFTPSNSATQRITLAYSSSLSNAVGYLDYIEITAISPLTMRGSYMPFRTTEGYVSGSAKDTLCYYLGEATATTLIWDITHLDSIYAVATKQKDDTVLFTGSNYDGIHEYIAVQPDGTFLTPTVIGRIKNQDLHALSDIDYVVITPEEFIEAAEVIATLHEQVEGLTTAIVTDQQVYNEFSSGTPDATAYRWVMKMLYDLANAGEGHKPQYLLLIGKGTFDNRKLLPYSGYNTLLTYQARNSTIETSAYATDDYFGFLDDNEGESDITARMDIAVGRLPVISQEEASIIAEKIRRYYYEPTFGNWRNKMVFLADDGDGNLHTEVAEAGAEPTRVKNPDFAVNKIYLDAYNQTISASGETYPLAENKLLNMLNSGVLFFDYSGHGSPSNMTSEAVINSAKVEAMTNGNKLGFWALATCNTSHFDQGDERCIAEKAMLNNHGGAIGVISPTRTVFASGNKVINANICDTLFAHDADNNYYMTIGKATQYAKNKTGNDINKSSYVLFGDPALRLAYPTQYQVKTESIADTVSALLIDTIRGYIQSPEGDTAIWFNGKVQVTLYDKLQRITTLDNDESNESRKKRITYNDYPSVLYNGTTDVTDGRFEIPFRVPKDIRYNYGAGRLLYYAYDPEAMEEGVGHYEQLIVGGTTRDISLLDTIGPEIKLYLNSPSFTDGAKTYEAPYFYADLYDESGINTAGAGIGHDLLLVIDNDMTQTYSMNDYFSSANNTYTRGQVAYHLSELKEGKHQLFFRAWDLVNNSSSQTLSFEVVKNLAPSIYNAVIYPNPVSASGSVHMRLDYDREESICEMTFYIYDISGHLVWSHTQPNDSEIIWDLGAMAITPGMYVYQLRVKATNTEESIKQGKIIVIN